MGKQHRGRAVDSADEESDDNCTRGAGSRDVRERDNRGGYRATRNGKGFEEMTEQVATRQDLRKLQAIGIGGTRTPDDTAALRTQPTDNAGRWCPICGVEKGKPKDGTYPFVVCFAHNAEYADSAQNHRVIMSAKAREIALALRARTLSPAALRPPTNQAAWALARVGDLQLLERELAEARRAHEALDSQARKEVSEILGEESLGQEIYRELLKQTRDATPGLQAAYYGMLRIQGRLAAAKALVARCKAEGIAPASFLTEEQIAAAVKQGQAATSAIPSEPEPVTAAEATEDAAPDAPATEARSDPAKAPISDEPTAEAA